MSWPELDEAIWAGDVDRLHVLASCRCCCHEHTFQSCKARQWGGCRGQGGEGDGEDYDAWRRAFPSLNWKDES